MAVLHSVVHLQLHLCGERVRSCGVRVWLRVGVGKADGYAAQSQKREERGEHRAVRSVQCSGGVELELETPKVYGDQRKRHTTIPVIWSDYCA